MEWERRDGGYDGKQGKIASRAFFPEHSSICAVYNTLISFLLNHLTN